jgi:hypothetical protein
MSSLKFDLFPKLKEPLYGKCFGSIKEVCAKVTGTILCCYQQQNLLRDMKKTYKVLGGKIKQDGTYTAGL